MSSHTNSVKAWALLLNHYHYPSSLAGYINFNDWKKFIFPRKTQTAPSSNSISIPKHRKPWWSSIYPPSGHICTRGQEKKSIFDSQFAFFNIQPKKPKRFARKVSPVAFNGCTIVFDANDRGK